MAGFKKFPPPVVLRRVPASSGVPVDFRPDLSSQLPIHGTLSARREAWTSDLGVEHQPPEAWASGQANYARRPRSQKQEVTLRRRIGRRQCTTGAQIHLE